MGVFRYHILKVLKEIGIEVFRQTFFQVYKLKISPEKKIIHLQALQPPILNVFPYIGLKQNRNADLLCQHLPYHRNAVYHNHPFKVRQCHAARIQPVHDNFPQTRAFRRQQ